VSLLFPDPPRRVPGHRALSIALRTVHVAAFGTLLGGHVFEIAPARLAPMLALTVASGVALVALEMASTCAWLVSGAGVFVAVKLALLLLVPVLWDWRVPLLFAVLVVASIGAHMPARFRHQPLLGRRRAGARAAAAMPQARGAPLSRGTAASRGRWPRSPRRRGS
jgi:hypothetical protein